MAISSLDRRALLEAIRLRDEVAGTVSVLTMGPAPGSPVGRSLPGAGGRQGHLPQ